MSSIKDTSTGTESKKISLDDITIFIDDNDPSISDISSPLSLILKKDFLKYLFRYTKFIYSKFVCEKLGKFDNYYLYLIKYKKGIYVLFISEGKILGYITPTEFFGNNVDITNSHKLKDIVQEYIDTNSPCNNLVFNNKTSDEEYFKEYEEFICSEYSYLKIYFFNKDKLNLWFYFIDFEQKIWVICFSKENKILGYTTPKDYYGDEKYCIKVCITIPNYSYPFFFPGDFYDFLRENQILTSEEFMESINYPFITGDAIDCDKSIYEKFKADPDTAFLRFRAYGNILYFFFKSVKFLKDLEGDIYVMIKSNKNDKILGYIKCEEYFKLL
jgi:hypothetical protein